MSKKSQPNQILQSTHEIDINNWHSTDNKSDSQFTHFQISYLAGNPACVWEIRTTQRTSYSQRPVMSTRHI